MGSDKDLRAFTFEEAKHVEVAVAFRRLRPELACDLDDGLDASAVYFDRVDALLHLLKRIDVDGSEKMLPNLAQAY